MQGRNGDEVAVDNASVFIDAPLLRLAVRALRHRGVTGDQKCYASVAAPEVVNSTTSTVCMNG